MLKSVQHRRLRLGFETLEPRLMLAVLTDPMLAGAVSDSAAKVFLRTDVGASVAVEYSESPGFESSVQTPTVATNDVGHFTAITTLSGLNSETKYYYRPVIDGEVPVDADVHSFTTAPIEGATRDFSFGVLADLINVATFPDHPAPAYASLAADDPAFVLQIGDFDHRDPEFLPVMRNMHRQVRSDLTAAGADFATNIAPQFPVYHIWDDHDYGHNNADKTFINRDAALRAFDEYYPTPDRPNSAGIWHSFEYAQAEFFMLDVRSQRDPVDTPNGPGKSMLDGDEILDGQLDWLKTGLQQSTATWKFIVSGVTFNGGTKPADAWAAYPDERQDLLDFIDDNGIGGVIVISGDLHTSGALDDGSIADLPEISVPHTNLMSNGTASGPAGTWSHGLVPGREGGGYSLISVTADEVLLENRKPDGTLRNSLTLAAASPFVDVTQLVGIEQPNNVVFGTGWVDFDENGRPDAYLGKHLTGTTAGKEPNLWLNQSDGVFQDGFASAFPGGVGGDTHGNQWIDFDNDGDQDLFQVAGAQRGLGSGPNKLYVNDAGVLTPAPQALGLDLPLGRARDVFWFDWNQDGLLDVLIANDKRQDGLQPSVLMEQGPSGFTDVTAAAGLDFDGYNADSFHVADITGDGLVDIMMLQSGNGGMQLFVGEPTGGFARDSSYLPTIQAGHDLAIGDFNGDGFNDVFVARANSRAPQVATPAADVISATLRNRVNELGFTFETTGDITFQFRKEHINDGRAAPGKVFIGSSGDNPASLPFTLSPTDPDIEGIASHTPGFGDGLYIGFDSANSRWEVRYSDEDFSRLDFVVQSTEAVANLQTLGFLSSDDMRLPDQLLVFDPQSGQLVDRTVAAGLNEPTAATSVVAVDIDNDRDLDLYVAEELTSAGLPDRIYTNDGNGQFTTTIISEPAGGPHVAHFGTGTKVIAADYNLDGFVDLFANGTKFPTVQTDFDGVPSRLLKNVGNNNHWIELDLVGVESNRDAIGAQVEVTAGGTTQVIDQRGGKHRLAQNSSRLHAGLGQHELIDEIVVHWPSGATTILTDVAADQIVEIVEADTPVVPATEVFYLTTAAPGSVASSNGSVLAFDDSDIIKLSVFGDGQFTYTMFLDGSDVGLTTNGEDIDALHIQADGSVLLSTTAEPSVRTDYLSPGTGSGATINATRRDLLLFTPQSTGQATTGSWSLFFEGASHDLTADAENIDAVSALADGTLLVSTTGSNSVPGVSARDEDVLAYDPSTSSWTLFFDGGDVGLTSFTDDVNGLSYSTGGGALGSLRMSSLGPLSTGAVAADKQDVYRFLPNSTGATTTGTFDSQLVLDGNAFGLAGHNITGFDQATQPTVVGGVGAVGDSLTDEYASQAFDYARNWVELLAVEKSVDFGDQSADWGDNRRDGYEHNWARVGATTTKLLEQGQHTSLAAQVQNGDVQFAIMQIGLNDFAGVFNEIYSGAYTDAQVDALVDDVVANIDSAVATLASSGANVVLSTIGDYSVFPKARTDFPDAAQRERVSQAVARASSRVEVIASSYQIPLVDLTRFGLSTLGSNNNVTPSISVGGVSFANAASVQPDHLFVDDGVHPHTISQALTANLIVTAINNGFGADLSLFSEQEIVELEGLTYGGDTFPLSYTDFVILPVSNDQSGPVASDVVATPMTAAPGEPILVEAAVSDSFDGGRAVTTAEYFFDTAGVPGTGTPMAAMDGAFDGATEFVSASIPEAVWSTLAGGQHTLLVRGQDAVGNWGPLASVVFDVPGSGGDQEKFYLSTTTNGQVTGSDNVTVDFTRNDILQLTLDGSGGYHYELYFDGGDVGLTENNETVDALHIRPDGGLVVSITRSGSVQTDYATAGVGSGPTIDADRQDLLLFTPISLGSDTTGSWSLLFDGSEHGLGANSENIDAVSILADGRLLLSTSGRFSVPGLSGPDRDIIAYDPVQDDWELIFDGSDLDLLSYTEDINGLSFNESANEYSLTTLNEFESGGVNAQGNDVIAFLPQTTGPDTSGSFRSPLDLVGDAVGLGGLVINGLHRDSQQSQAATGPEGEPAPTGGAGLESQMVEDVNGDNLVTMSDVRVVYSQLLDVGSGSAEKELGRSAVGRENAVTVGDLRRVFARASLGLPVEPVADLQSTDHVAWATPFASLPDLDRQGVDLTERSEAWESDEDWWWSLAKI